MRSQHNQNIYHMYTKSKNYNIKVYYCHNCGHIFHTTKVDLDICTKCNNGYLSIIDKYKSKKPPRASGIKNRWFTKWSFYENTKMFKIKGV
jgi:hypothetical protein